MLGTVFPSCFSSFPLVFSWSQDLHFWSWACLGLELMGLGISTNSIYSHFKLVFVAFQAATSAGGGVKCYSRRCTTSYLLCLRTLVSVWLSHKNLSVFCGIPPSTFHFVPEFEHYLATWGILGLTVSVFIIISSKKMSVPVKSLPIPLSVLNFE